MTTKETSKNSVAKKSSGVHINVLLGGVFLTLILWVLGSAFAWQSYQKTESAAKENMINLGTRLAHHTSISIKNVDVALLRTANHYGKDWEENTQKAVDIHDFLVTAFSGIQHIKDVAILDIDGKVIYSRRFDYLDPKAESTTDFIDHRLLKTERIVQIGNLQAQDAIGLSRPIYDLQASLKGYVVAKIRADYLKEIYELGLDNQGYRFAIDEPEGRILSIPADFPDVYDIKSFFSQQKSQYLQIEASPEGEVLSSHTKVPSYELIITADLPLKAVFKDWEEATFSYAILGLVFSLVLLFATRQLQKAVQAIDDENVIRKQVELDLRKLSRAVEQSPTSIIITDTNAKIEYVNPQFTKNTGYLPEEVIGENPKILSAHQDDQTDYSSMWETLSAGETWKGNFCNRHKDGSIFWESATITPIKNDDGKISHFLAIKEDITKKKHAEDQLELAAAVFETASEAIMVCNRDNIIETVNTAFSEITGYSQVEVVGQPPSILKSGHHSASFYNRMVKQISETGKWEGEIWNRRKNGEIYPQWLSIKTIRDEHGEILRYISLFSDITHRKKNEERILYQANYDALTGLPNRSLFMDRLKGAVVRAERSDTKIALLFIDLDRFKNVNDSLGHACGDLLLKEAADRLTSIVRKSDTVARLGGDEFTVILNDLSDIYLIESLVENMLKSLSAPFDLENNIAFVSASIGITIFPDDAANVDELLKNADAAMYQAKENGRNLSQFFTKQMNEEAQERRALETALHQALEREEFVLHYQPIIDSRTNMLASCEVLLRWMQPEHGNVYPDKFIPLAEDTGLILPIGEWVLYTACREAKMWEKYSDTPPNVSVNMSSRQFQRVNVADLVQRVLKDTRLSPHRLTLEITESLLIGDDDNIVTQLHEIRNMGIGISIDDFGTGYSSLSYLRRFPITTLKIDRAFIMDLQNDNEANAVVSAILSMAESLSLKVVAEGVETKDQLTLLRLGGCDYIQGYYFSPPTPIEAFRQFVKQNAPIKPYE